MAKTAGGTSNSGKEVRDARIWNAIDGIHADLGYLKTDLAGITTRLEGVAEALRLNRVSVEELTKQGRFPWQIVIGVVTVALMIIGAGITAVLAPLYLSDSFMRGQILDISNSIDKHANQPGHPAAMVLAAQLEKDVQRIDGNVHEVKALIESVNERSEARHEVALVKVEALDTNLQREMRDLDRVQETRITSLDDMLQREMRFIDDIQSAKREALSERVGNNEKHLQGRDGLRFNMPDYERMVNPKLNDLEARMLSVEKSRFTATDSEAIKQLQLQQAERISRLEAELDAAMGKIEDKLRVTPSDVLNEVKRRNNDGD